MEESMGGEECCEMSFQHGMAMAPIVEAVITSHSGFGYLSQWLWLPATVAVVTCHRSYGYLYKIKSTRPANTPAGGTHWTQWVMNEGEKRKRKKRSGTWEGDI